MALSNERPTVAAVPCLSRPVDPDCEREFHAFVMSKERVLRRGVIRALRLLQRPYDDEEVAENLQEAYCRLLSSRVRRVEIWRELHEGPCEAYLARLAERAVFDRVRHAEAAKRRPRRPNVAIDDLPRAVVLRCPRPTAEAALLARERRAAFWRGLLTAGGIVGRDSERMVALAIAGRGSREIAAALDHRVKPSSIDTLLHRFRRRLAEQGIELPHRSRTLGDPESAPVPALPSRAKVPRQKRFSPKVELAAAENRAADMPTRRGHGH